MDIFRFNNPSDPTLLKNGEIIDGFTSKMWIERYDKAGEFELKALISSGIRERLPIGTLISHVDTTEVMIVENHEISDEQGSESELTISGRGFETYLENRTVGSEYTFPTAVPPGNYYSLGSDYSWNQIMYMIVDHAIDTADPDNEIPHLSISIDMTGTGTIANRDVKNKDLYSCILELLKIDGLGVKVIRPGPWSPTWGDPDEENISLVIHRGVDRTQEIIFSYDTGEIESADYLWSNKNFKNAAWIKGKWVQAFVSLGQTGYERRVMMIEDDRYDKDLDTFPDTAQTDTIRAQLEQLGLQTLANQTELSIARAEVSKDVVKAGYRTDFNVGDLITVLGDYGTSTTRRIEEYVEIEDKNGTKSYPTLSTV